MVNDNDEDNENEEDNDNDDDTELSCGVEAGWEHIGGKLSRFSEAGRQHKRKVIGHPSAVGAE
jgi:hypothetical protein